MLSVKSQHIQELETQLESLNEELKVEKQKTQSVEEVNIQQDTKGAPT